MFCICPHPQPLEEHINEEENEWMPQLRSKLSEQQVMDLAKSFESAKDHEPTRPHVLPPNKPATGNILANISTAPLDWLRDSAGRWGNDPIPSVVKHKHESGPKKHIS